MRIRLQLLLPLLVGVLLGAGFLLAGAMVGDAVRDALRTVPGITRERAVEAALRAVAVAGVVITIFGVVAGALLARMIVRPLSRIRRLAERLQSDPVPHARGTAGTPVAEIWDVAVGFNRAADELRDRHERVLRERSELEALVEAVSEGIVQVDGAGRVVRANPASRTLLGLPADATGRPIASFLRNAELRRISERGAAGEAMTAAEVVLEERRILVSMSPQPAGGFVATLVDLTDLRRLEEVRRDFVANASHELKTPLTSIRGYSETLLADDLSDEERQRFLATIARNADRLQRIVDDLLDLSRLEAGRWEPALEPLHALRIAESSWTPHADRAEARGIRFRRQKEGSDLVLADRGALEQVFANLYDNALRHTNEGGTIHVTCRTAASELPSGCSDPAGGRGGAGVDSWTVVEIRDTGTGIPRDSLPRIFERFYRVDPARSRAEGGTGLGLSIVKHMVESMGGQVQAESVLGRGTTIRLMLPTARP